MAVYWLRFGSGNPQTTTGLAPTFLAFNSFSGTAITPPGITETPAGSGLYRFEYAPTFSIAFIADGNTTGLQNAVRYVSGAIDRNDRIDESVFALGTTLTAIGVTAAATGATVTAIGTTLAAQGGTLVAIGNSLAAIGVTVGAIGVTVAGLGVSLNVVIAGIGSTASPFGGTSADPVDLFGYVRRIQEFLEGNQTFNKTSGAFAIYSRGGATLLAQKAINNDASGVTRI